MPSSVRDALARVGDLLAAIPDTVIGGALATIGGFLGAWWTTRHAALVRQRAACQEMLRLTSRMWEALSAEEAASRELDQAEQREHEQQARPGRTSDDFDDLLRSIEADATPARARDRSAQAAVDHLAGELAIFALDIRGRVQQRVKTCVAAIQERRYLGPPLTTNGRRATWGIEQVIKASLNRRWRRRPGQHVRTTIKELGAEVSEAVYLREEQDRAYDQWVHEERQRRERERQQRREGGGGDADKA